MTSKNRPPGFPRNLSIYDFGMAYCSRCADIVRKDDPRKVRLNKAGRLIHDDCGSPLRVHPHESSRRVKFHERQGVKRYD